MDYPTFEHLDDGSAAKPAYTTVSGAQVHNIKEYVDPEYSSRKVKQLHSSYAELVDPSALCDVYSPWSFR